MMEKILLFTKVKLKDGNKEKTFKIFLLLFLILIFCTPQLFKASASNSVDVEESYGKAILYVSGEATIYNISSVTNAVVVLENSPVVEQLAKHANLSLAKQITPPETVEKVKTKKIETPYSPKQTVRSIPNDQKFAAGSSSGKATSVLTNHFTDSNLVITHYGEIKIPLFAYLLKIYTADFSKTAALSQFLFSRPPPQLIA